MIVCFFALYVGVFYHVSYAVFRLLHLVRANVS